MNTPSTLPVASTLFRLITLDCRNSSFAGDYCYFPGSGFYVFPLRVISMRSSPHNLTCSEEESMFVISEDLPLPVHIYNSVLSLLQLGSLYKRIRK